ncbi:2-hydroxyacyl-CoA dehydratase subunit D [Chloroflexota bacterium]
MSNPNAGALDKTLEHMHTSLERVGAFMLGNGMAYRMQIEHVKRLRDAVLTGKPIVYQNFSLHSELFWAMDMVPIIIDGLALELSRGEGGRGALDYIDLAERYAPGHLCADNKTTLGAALSGAMPKPSLIVHASAPCDSANISYPAMADFYGVPHYCIDMPYFKDERGFQYMSGELKRLVTLLEEITGRKMDFDRLKQVMEYANTAQEYWLKMRELRRNIPCPIGAIDAVADANNLGNMIGTPFLADYMKERYELVKDRVDRKVGQIEKEKYRVVWPYGWAIFDPTLITMLEQKYNAVTVATMFSNSMAQPLEDISDYDKLMMSLAKKYVNLPMIMEVYNTYEAFVDTAIEMYRHFNADVAIFGGHIACKSNWAMMKLIKDKIQEETGLPLLVIEWDDFDPRVTSAESVRAQIDEFFETIVTKMVKPRA